MESGGNEKIGYRSSFGFVCVFARDEFLWDIDMYGKLWIIWYDNKLPKEIKMKEYI